MRSPSHASNSQGLSPSSKGGIAAGTIVAALALATAAATVTVLHLIRKKRKSASLDSGKLKNGTRRGSIVNDPSLIEQHYEDNPLSKNVFVQEIGIMGKNGTKVCHNPLAVASRGSGTNPLYEP